MLKAPPSPLDVVANDPLSGSERALADSLYEHLAAMHLADPVKFAGAMERLQDANDCLADFPYISERVKVAVSQWLAEKYRSLLAEVVPIETAESA